MRVQLQRSFGFSSEKLCKSFHEETRAKRSARLSYADINGDGVIADYQGRVCRDKFLNLYGRCNTWGYITKKEILEENNYYPFGLEHNYNNYPNGNAGNWYKYKYNGKEMQEELGLNVTAMDFRQYDNTLGRFLNTDALSEFYFSHTPYNFSANNPIRISYPSGLVWYQNNESGEFVYYNGEKERDGYTSLGANYSYYTQGRWIDLRTEYDDDGNELYGAVDFYDQDGNYENSTIYLSQKDVVAKGTKSKNNSMEEWFYSQGAYNGAGDRNSFYNPNNTTFTNLELSIGASAYSKVIFEIMKESGLLEKEKNPYGYYYHYRIVDQDSLKKLLSSSDFIKS